MNRSSCSSKTKACPFEWYCLDPGAPQQGACGGSVVCGADNTSERTMRSGEKQGQEEQEVGDVRSVGVLLKQGQQHPKPSPSRTPVWIEVDIAPGVKPGTVHVDLQKLNGSTPVAIRYAWSNNQPSCCLHSADGGLFRDYPCPGGSCPLKTAHSSLPANPFMAKLTKTGKCRCIAPQQCDE